MAKYYVYELVDPLADAVFYVGKGSGRRMHDHADEARRGVHSKKCERIRAIWAAGAELRTKVVARFDDENEALQAEFDLIEAIGLESLTNVLPGGVLGIAAYMARKAEQEQRKAERLERDRLEAFTDLAPKFAQVLRTRKAGQDFGAYVGGRWLEFGAAFEAIFHDMANAIGFEVAKETMAPHGIELVRAPNGRTEECQT